MRRKRKRAADSCVDVCIPHYLCTPRPRRTWERPWGAGRDPPSGWNAASFIDSSGSLWKCFTHSGHGTVTSWFSTYKRHNVSRHDHISAFFQPSDEPNFVFVGVSLGLQTDALISPPPPTSFHTHNSNVSSVLFCTSFVILGSRLH